MDALELLEPALSKSKMLVGTKELKNYPLTRWRPPCKWSVQNNKSKLRD